MVHVMTLDCMTRRGTEKLRKSERNPTTGADMRYCSCCVTVVRNSVSFHLACDFLASAASRLKVNAAACVRRE